MKKLLLLTLLLILCPSLEAQAQSQTPSRKKPEFSPHSKRTRFAKQPYSWLKEMKGDSSLQDERLRNLLPPHLQDMAELPPHLAAERRWLWESENERTGLAPNDPFDRLYPPHKRPLAQMPTPLKIGAPQTLSGSAQEAWVARYDGLSSSNDVARAMVIDAAGNVYVTGYSYREYFFYRGYIAYGSHPDYLTIKYNSAGVRQWTARYNGPGDKDDEAIALAVDGSGNVYVTGTSGTYPFDYDYATVKYNSSGIQQWVRTYNGPGNWVDEAKALAIDAAGNVYVTGRSVGSGTGSDFATIKYNAAGTQQWVATYTGPGNSDEFPVALAVDGAGGAAGAIYVTGHSWYGTPHNYVTIKYNSAGTQKWIKTYDNGSENFGYHVHDPALALDPTGGGSVYMVAANWNGTSYDYATIKYDTAGTLKWVKTYNGPGNGDDWACALAVDGKGNVYVTGYSGGSLIGADYATVKYNSAGTQEWVATVGSGRGEDDYPIALAVDGDGNVYVTGVRGENFYTVKYNSAGAKRWAATYNGPENLTDNPVALGLDASGNVYVAGSSYGLGTYSDYATVKYSALGVEKWVARHDEPSPAHDMATAMVVDGAGNIYVTGSSGTVGSSQDYLTIKYNAAGVQQWAANYNGPGNGEDVAQALAVDDAGNVYVTGYSWNKVTLNDYVTIKYNAAGIQQWVAIYDGPKTTKNYSNDHAAAIGIDAAGNVYVTGFQWHGYSASYEDFGYTTVKYNSSGTQEWVAGGGEAIVVDDAGNVYVTGSTLNDNDSEEYDYFTAKYNSSGKLQWGRRYNSLYDDDEAVALAVDGAGNVYVTGNSGGWHSTGYATVKYNAAGIQQWVAHYKRSGYENEYAHAIAVDGTGNVYVTGSSGTVKYNSAGKQQWVGDSPGSALALDGAGNVYVTGSSDSDYVTIRYNNAGTPQWATRYNGPGNDNDYPVALAVDHTGNIYVAGGSVGAGTGYDFATIKYPPSPLVDAGPDKEICAGGSVQIGGNPTGSGGNGGPYTFSWAPTAGLNDPTVPNPIAAPATTTTYTVTITETATGRAAIDEVTITARTTGWSVAHIVDVDDIIFGINQGATIGAAPRNNRGLAVSPNGRFLYLGYSMPSNKRLVRKIDLNVTQTGVVDPANNHSAVVAQLQLPPGTQPARDIATDDRGRVYLALGTKIEVYHPALPISPLHIITGFTACEGVTTRRENGTLAVYATDRLDKTLERFALVEGTGLAITSSTKTGLDGDGEVRIIGANSPRGLDIASNGTAWIADISRSRVYRVNSAGSTVDSTGVSNAMDIAIDAGRGEAYVSQFTLRTIKVLNLSTGKIKRTITPPAADLNVDLDGDVGTGALCGIDVASCKRVFVANENGRSLLTGNPLDSPFSNTDDNNDVKAADTDPVLVVTGSGLAKESEVEEPEVVSDQLTVTSYQLEQNYPNPFWSGATSRLAGNPSTTINFALPEAAEVSLKIYDIAGQLVQTLVIGGIEAGRHQVVWDGTNQHGVKVASGVYFYQLRAGAFKQVRKMSLVR
jgi:uncharacterized delta-60 repeat protein